MDLLIDSLKSLLRIEDAEQDEEDVFRDLVGTLQATKYTSTNSNTDVMKKLLEAIDSDDPTQIGPLFEPKIDWDLTEPKKVTELKSSQTTEEKSSELNRWSDDDITLPLTSWNNNKAEKPNAQDGKSTDQWHSPLFNDLLHNQMDLMRLLKSEYNNLLPAPPVHQSAKFGKEGGRNFNLGFYDVPDWIMECLESNGVRRLGLDEPLTMKNYVERFQTLLWLEEAHQTIQMRRYDMTNVMLAKGDNGTYIIDVPGLAEGRPSLMRGDSVLLKSSHRNCYYQAHIVEVREKEIVIRAHESLRSSARDGGLFFDVHFVSSRTPFRRCHHGVNMFKKLNHIQDVVFPITRLNLKPPMIKVKDEPMKIRCFMRDLNIYQRNAVVKVLENRCRPNPYIIFGPPGTGKTVTLVEAIFQIYARFPTSKILVCTNSNASADLIAHRVYEKKLIDEDKLVRVSAFYRFDQDIIPEEVKPITKQMDMISAYDYTQYRLVISTCIQSGSLYEFKERFDYVLIDEAGHANEGEALISLGLMKSQGACVLAGDPHQLGPVCVSPIAKHYGLGISLLERVFKRACYSKRIVEQTDSVANYDDNFITKLITSYRCDPRIMVVNNKQFYDNELQFVVETPFKWLEVVKADKPLIFHEVKGRDRREYLNPSWFNANEAIKCMIYVNSLYKAGLEPKQLGIITPYRRQIDKIKTLFASLNLTPCKIATMEEFQGDEREVIIISTVRSRPKHLKHDKDFRLGFLFEPKRFNVGISRAKWLTIVIGNSEMLKRDKLWIEYIENSCKFDMIEETTNPEQEEEEREKQQQDQPDSQNNNVLSDQGP